VRRAVALHEAAVPVDAPGPSVATSASRARVVLLTALLCAAVIAGYLPALHGGFIWDDTILLTENPLVKAPDGLYRFWLTTEAPDYWPLTSTSFWLEWRLWGTSSTGYHVTNLVLHAVEALLLWALLARLGIGGGYLAALLFAVHPVNVESVAWIAQRKNLVAMLFLLVSALFYVESVVLKPPGGRRLYRPGAGLGYALSLGAFVLAMLGKGSAAVLPLLLLLLVFWRWRRLGRSDLVRVVPFLVVGALLVLVNIWFQTHGRGSFREASVLERVLGAGGVVWFYLGKALLPIRLSFVYPQWHVDPGVLWWWVPLLAAAGVSMALFLKRDGWGRPFFVTWAAFCVALLPVMGLTDVYFMTFSLVADHYQHIALIAVVALAGAGWSRWYGRAAGARRLAPLGTAVVVVGVLTLLTARQSATYESEETLYRATIERNPACWLAHYNLAVDLERQGRSEEAFAHLQEAVRIKPDYAEAHNNLALALLERGQPDEALVHARAAVESRPDLPQALVNLGLLLNRAGRPDEAIPHLEKAVRLRPGSAEARYNLGLALAGVGRLPEAMDQYGEALRLDPGSAEARNALGTAWLASGRCEEATKDLEGALELRPDYAEAHANLGLALTRCGRAHDATAQYEEALRLRPDYAEAHYNLGVLLSLAGRTGEGVRHYEEALRIRPDYAEAHNNLAVALAGQGQTQAAVRHLEKAVKIAPGFLDARVNLAETYARSGRMADAASEARQALDLARAAGRPALERALERKAVAWGRIGGARR
jgi:tetratricopeptide (TPR) repeat protein